jgi:hypothetical protein
MRQQLPHRETALIAGRYHDDGAACLGKIQRRGKLTMIVGIVT